MRGAKIVNYLDFSGGLNTQGAYIIEPTQVRDALNVHATPEGSIRKRNGFVRVNSVGKILHSLAAANTSTKSLIGVGPGATTDTMLNISTAGTTTNLKTGLTLNKRWEWAQAQTGAGPVGPMYGLNGADTPQLWDGTAGSTSNWVATTGTVPNGTMIRFHGSRIWVAGNAAAPGRLYYSGITGTAPDPLNWDANDYVDLEPNDGQAITGIGTHGPYLIVFKPRKTYVIYDLATGANKKISDNAGCIAPRSVVETPKGTFFLSQGDGVMSTDGAKVWRISDNVATTLTSAGASQVTMSQAAGFYANYSYYLSFSKNLAVNDHTFEYNLPTESWWLHDCASNQFALIDPVGQPVLYSAKPTVQTLEKAFTPGIFQDAGANYAGGSFFTTAYLIWGQPSMLKRVRQVRVDGIGVWSTQAATEFTDVFNGLEGELWDSTPDAGGSFGIEGTFGGTGTFGPAFSSTASYRFYTPGQARAWAFKFLNSDSYDFEIFSLTAALDLQKD